MTNEAPIDMGSTIETEPVEAAAPVDASPVEGEAPAPVAASPVEGEAPAPVDASPVEGEAPAPADAAAHADDPDPVDLPRHEYQPVTGARALARLSIALGVCGLLAGATYVVPTLSTYRPWIPGEPVPLATVFTFDVNGASPLVSPSIAAPAPVFATADQARESVAADLGDAVAANLGEEAGVALEELEPFDRPSVFDLALVEPAPGETMPAAPTHPRPPRARSIHVSEKEYQGIAREIEDPSGTALDAFYASLRATAEQQDGALTRISHWGDSTIAADGITSTLRRRMQKRFGDGGHGFVLIAKSYMPYRHNDIVHKENDGWKIYPVLNGGLRSGMYGFGGVTYQSNGGAKSTFGTVEKGPIGTSVSRFELYYQGHPSGGDLQLSVDDAPNEVLSTKADETADMWKVIEVPDGPHSLTVRAGGRGQVRLYGMVLEREGPGVVYDSLGIVGARAARLLNADADHLAGQIRHRDPDLIVLAFGGNEAVDRRMSIKWYEGKLTEVIRTMRAGKPEASCLLMAPLDQGERDERGNVVTIPIVPKIVEAQRRIAAQEGCAYFDTFEAMGGRGAMLRWFRSKPRLGWGDFVHATPAGYEVIGNMLYKALMKGFADYLER